LTVQFNSRGKRGMRNQKVTLTGNTNPPQTFLSLSGEVTPLDPSDANVDLIGEDEDAKPAIAPDCFAIYPKPTAELLKLEMQENNLGKSATITIMSQSGQVMAKRNIEMISGTLEFNVSHYPAGTYIANVQIGDRKP